MPTTSRDISASPDAIWAVLADAQSYARWVLGITRIIAADPAWPTPGSTIEYSFRYGPLMLRGHAEVLEAQSPRHLRWRWRRGLLGPSIADLVVEPAFGPKSDGDVLRMRHELGGLFVGFTANPLVGGLSAANDVTSLGRLERLALERAPREVRGL